MTAACFPLDHCSIWGRHGFARLSSKKAELQGLSLNKSYGHMAAVLPLVLKYKN